MLSQPDCRHAVGSIPALALPLVFNVWKYHIDNWLKPYSTRSNLPTQFLLLTGLAIPFFCSIFHFRLIPTHSNPFGKFLDKKKHNVFWIHACHQPRFGDNQLQNTTGIKNRFKQSRGDTYASFLLILEKILSGSVVNLLSFSIL